MSKVGILGGSFSPPHNAHLLLATFAKSQFNLDYILVIPGTTFNSDKNEEPVAPYHRFNMACIAASNVEFLKVSDCELNGKSYTVDTLRRLKASQKNDEFHFIGGSDNLRHFAHWKEPQEIVKLTKFIIAQRFGSTFEEARDAMLSCGAPKENILRLDFPNIEISSSMVRQRLRDCLDCTYLLQEGVLRYIKANRLYKEAQTGN